MNCEQVRFSLTQGPAYGEDLLRWEERQKERVRIARELHDTLFQGFVGASLLLHRAVEETAPDSPSRPSLTRALGVIQRVIEEGRLAVQGLRSSGAGSNSLEKALSGLRDELILQDGVELHVIVAGRRRPVDPKACQQLYLIAREAAANALRHSGASKIEIDLEYTGRHVKLAVRDNGCGMDQEAVRPGRDSHWGLLGMRERAEDIGAKLRVWSKPGAGTEVEISLNAN